MRSAAFGIAIVERRVLMVRLSSLYVRHGGLWTFPGGLVDAGERPVDAAVREVMEETGARLFPVHRYAVGDEGVPCDFWLSGAEPGHGRPDSPEIADVRWCTYEEAISLPLAYAETNRPILERLRRDGILGH